MARPAKVVRALLGAIGDSDYSGLAEAQRVNKEHEKQVGSLPSLDDKVLYTSPRCVFVLKLIRSAPRTLCRGTGRPARKPTITTQDQKEDIQCF